MIHKNDLSKHEESNTTSHRSVSSPPAIKKATNHIIPSCEDKMRWLLVSWIIIYSFLLLLIFVTTRDASILASFTILGGAISIVFAYYFSRK